MIDPIPFGPFKWRGVSWESEPVAAPLLGGAEVRIQVIPEGESDNAVLTGDQIEVLQRFLALPQARGDEIIPHLWAYYQHMWDVIGPPDIPEISDPSTIWDHVRPRSIALEQDEHGVLYVSVEAECDWEIEHGLQLVLQHGTRWVRVSDYSGHLTDGDAWGKPFLDDWITDPSKTLPVRTHDEISEARE